MSIIVDETSEAAFPGHVKIEPIKFLAYFKVTGLRKIYYLLLLSVCPTNVLHRVFKNDAIIIQWIEKVEHFQMGCINPSIIVNKDKGLIATFTNLTNNGDNPTPVIKISHEKLNLIKGREILNGQKNPTVALYLGYDNSEATAWKDFEPYIPNCFTNDVNAYNFTLNSVSINAWQCLQLGLEQIDDIEVPGLYYVNIDKDLVNASY